MLRPSVSGMSAACWVEDDAENCRGEGVENGKGVIAQVGKAWGKKDEEGGSCGSREGTVLARNLEHFFVARQEGKIWSSSC